MVSGQSQWKIYLSESVSLIYEKLKSDSVELLQKNPANITHPKVKDFINIRKAIWDASVDPNDEAFWLGKSLGSHTSWRRLKRDIPERYRFFFRFFSEEQEIYFVWINDERHIRRAGHRSDVYREFSRKLDAGKVPEERVDLSEESVVYDLEQFNPDQPPRKPI